jgi:hypothetical protein
VGPTSTNHVSESEAVLLSGASELQKTSAWSAPTTLNECIAMAEALAVIGLASNILSFVDFGMKLASVSKDIRDSSHGMTAEVKQLADIAASLESWVDKVKKSRLSRANLSNDELNMLKVAEDCERLVPQIQEKLTKMRTREDATWKAFESLRVATRTLLGGWELKDMGVKLADLDQRFKEHFTQALRS